MGTGTRYNCVYFFELPCITEGGDGRRGSLAALMPLQRVELQSRSCNAISAPISSPSNRISARTSAIRAPTPKRCVARAFSQFLSSWPRTSPAISSLRNAGQFKERYALISGSSSHSISAFQPCYSFKMIISVKKNPTKPHSLSTFTDHCPSPSTCLPSVWRLLLERMLERSVSNSTN